MKKRRHLVLIFFAVGSFVLLAAGYAVFILRDIPSVQVLKHLENKPASVVYGRNNEVVYLLLPDNRIFVDYGRIPKYVRDAFLAAEDADFFKHGAVDFSGIMRALWKNVVYGRVVQGGSTITQQVIKSLVLGPERSISRKLREAVLAYRLERNLSKKEILNLYLNNVYMGHGVYGVEAASQIYFARHVWEITRAEGALLAGIVQAPSRYSPKRHPGNARVRQEYVINQMHEKGFIDAKRHLEMMREKVVVREDNGVFAESYYKDHLIRYAEERLGKGILSRKKLKIYAAVDGEMQRSAEAVVSRGLGMYGERKGDYVFLYRLEEKSWKSFMQASERDMKVTKLQPGKSYKVLVTEQADNTGYVVHIGKEKGRLDMDAFPYTAGDVVRATYAGTDKKRGHIFKPIKTINAEAALLCMDVDTGYIYAMVGGKDFDKSPYNRATQAKLQAGSAFKPFIYAAALKKGYNIDAVLPDEPRSYPSGSGTWTPRNYDGKYSGTVSMRDAVAYSKNAATVSLLENIGVGAVKDLLADLGIGADVPHNLSIALGTSGLTLLDLVKGFSAFANGGFRVKPIFVLRIEDDRGQVLDSSEVQKQRAIPEDVAVKMNILLRGPTEYGTAKGASRLGYPVAGKTGTTSNYYDALFIGYSPHIATGVWVGFDTRTSLGKGESGARVCLPIWMGFMAPALRRFPSEDFPGLSEPAHVEPVPREEATLPLRDWR